ncbi:DoxX family protein [Altererythrobacter sp. SALINAS58]|uniref:DoxX family protein n=1 Tax=Alteripontixanthobacter muriae TaxID=2705546 RepID=UPI001575FA45|nr:DoxX family protein [Alteripontixanthobacter muriae]NTZ42353.1 DoxX family protein [Alteripontixanthobacter muriae]
MPQTHNRIASLLLLDDLERFSDFGLLLLRCVTGAFLIYQSHDNVFSAERMGEFEAFMLQFGFSNPEFLAPLSVYAQFIAGIGFVLGVFTRWLGLVTTFNFIVALVMVHWGQDVPQIWPAAVLVFLGLYFGVRGAGRFSIDHKLGKSDERT